MKKIVGALFVPLLAAVLSIAIALVSCSDSPTQEQQIVRAYLDEPFTIHLGQEARLYRTGISITFRKFDFDLRCCDFCFCTWEGIAAADLWLKTADFEGPFYLFISGSGSSDDVHKMKRLLSGYEFSLTSLEPIHVNFPIDKAATPPLAPGEATIIISKATEEDSLAGSVVLSDLPPLILQVSEFNLTDAAVSGDILKLDLDYSGGCHPHYFWSYMSPSTFSEGTPREANIYLRHANFDPCDALISDEVYFDLTPLKEAYLSEFGQPDQIKLNIYKYSLEEPDQKLEILYLPED